MVEKNLKKLKARKHRVMAPFNTGTRDMKLKTAYRRKKKWSADDADHFRFSNLSVVTLFDDNDSFAEFKQSFPKAGRFEAFYVGCVSVMNDSFNPSDKNPRQSYIFNLQQAFYFPACP